MGYIFKWDPVKAEANVRIHLGTFEQTSTVFGNLLNLVTADPDHSRDEERYLLLGMSNRRRLLVVAFAERAPQSRLISARRTIRQERRFYEEEQ